MYEESEFIISEDKTKIDVNYVHGFLTNSYWSPGIPIETVKKSIDNSMCFGVYHNNHSDHDKSQVGFARMITDKASFAYLADVFIDEQFRGKGLSKLLVKSILAHPDLQGLRRIMLATRDAHSLYTQFGFSQLNNVDKWMHIHNPDVYQHAIGNEQ